MLDGDERRSGLWSVSAEPLFVAGALPEVKSWTKRPGAVSEYFSCLTDIRGMLTEP